MISEKEVKPCKCGCSAVYIWHSGDGKWHLECYACKKEGDKCRTRKRAILAWNGMNS